MTLLINSINFLQSTGFIFQPRSQGLSLPAPKSERAGRERPWERGCSFSCLSNEADEFKEIQDGGSKMADPR